MKIFVFLVFAILIISSSCRKEKQAAVKDCIHMYDTAKKFYSIYTNLYSGYHYSKPICGFLPLDTNNYWVYRDSVFNSITGQFDHQVLDTIRFREAYTYPGDTIIWWKPVLSLTFPADGYRKGYLDRMYTTDSVLYGLLEGAFSNKFSDKWCSYLKTDSVTRINRWNDVAVVVSRDYKNNNPVAVPAGVYNDCLRFEKRIGGYTADSQAIYYKPGIGVVKSSYYKLDVDITTFTTTVIQWYSSELVSYHIE